MVRGIDPFKLYSAGSSSAAAASRMYAVPVTQAANSASATAPPATIGGRASVFDCCHSITITSAQHGVRQITKWCDWIWRFVTRFCRNSSVPPIRNGAEKRGGSETFPRQQEWQGSSAAIPA